MALFGEVVGLWIFAGGEGWLVEGTECYTNLYLLSM